MAIGNRFDDNSGRSADEKRLDLAKLKSPMRRMLLERCTATGPLAQTGPGEKMYLCCPGTRNRYFPTKKK